MADTQQNNLKETITLTKSLKNQVSEASAAFSKLFSLSSGITFLVSRTTDAVKELKNMDQILTDISKTSHMSKSNLKEFYDTAFDKASKYGQSVSDYLTSVQNMSHAGYDNADQMAELSLLAQNSGSISQELSDSYLTASDAAYHLEGNVEALGKILDGQTSIVQNTKVQMDDMSAATIEAASTAAQYGIQAEELSALIALVSANTMESGTKTGEALSYIFSSLNAADPFKNPIQQLEELASAYHSVKDSANEPSMLEQFGGAEYTDTMKVILENWSSYGELLSIYANGSGSAMEEANKNATNLTGSLNTLSNSWTEFVNSIISSDELKTGVNLLNGIVQGITNITSSLGALGTIGLGVGIFDGIKNVGVTQL